MRCEDSPRSQSPLRLNKKHSSRQRWFLLIALGDRRLGQATRIRFKLTPDELRSFAAQNRLGDSSIPFLTGNLYRKSTVIPSEPLIHMGNSSNLKA